MREKSWVTLREATRIWKGSNTYAVMRAAAVDEVRVLARPGDPLKFNREDVERLATERGTLAATA
jgi:hypothetical protein